MADSTPPASLGRLPFIKKSSFDSSSSEEERLRRLCIIEQTEVRTSFKLDPKGADVLDIVATLLRVYENEDYYAYERNGDWHVGLGSRASLVVDPEGKAATIHTGGKASNRQITASIADVAREFVAKTAKHGGGRIFGQVGVNYAFHVRGMNYGPGEWPLMSMMAPKSEITIHQHHVTVTGHDYEATLGICEVLQGPIESFNLAKSIPVDTSIGGQDYQARVSNAISEIKNHQYLKVIISRSVDLPEKVDMPATLVKGRRGNTPARTFSFKHAGIEATGFSPELVLCLDKGKIITEPLAGTRTRLGSKLDIETNRRELVSDNKEIVEHVISVKAAMDELVNLCEPNTTVVEELMAVRERGSVQHLGSRVAGSLLPSKDGWDALDVLFPAITASGIPKSEALDAIERLELKPRELYSGAVFMIEGTDFFEATLVLRTVFQDKDRSWFQAGAGIIEQSMPEREWTETKEKLASVAPFLVGKSGDSAMYEAPTPRPSLRNREWSDFQGLSKYEDALATV